jgi:ribosomal-protein-alanine N-acetyltransferase
VSRPFFIGEATGADIEALRLLEERCSPHPWTARHFTGAIDPALRTRTLVLRRVAGTALVVGYCAYRRVADEVHVENLAVEAALRRQGWARLLLRTALGAALKDGARRALLEVRQGNVAAQRLYEVEGFVCVGRRSRYYASPLEDALVFTRDLRVDSHP